MRLAPGESGRPVPRRPVPEENRKRIEAPRRRGVPHERECADIRPPGVRPPGGAILPRLLDSIGRLFALVGDLPQRLEMSRRASLAPFLRLISGEMRFSLSARVSDGRKM